MGNADSGMCTGGLPRFFNSVNMRFAAPIRTICLAAFLAFLLAIPSLGSSVAFAAATSIATIGLYISYGLPILIGLMYPSQFNSIKGPFNLGFASRPIAVVAVLYAEDLQASSPSNQIF